MSYSVQELGDEITRLKQALAEKDAAYQQLMAKAVRFAEWIDNDQDYCMQIHSIAKEFLNSPEVQTWREQK